MTWEEVNKICKEHGLKCKCIGRAPFAAIFVYRDVLRDGRYLCLTESLEFLSEGRLMELILDFTFC